MLLIIWLAWQLARLSWLLIPRPDPGEQTVAQPVTHVAPGAGGRSTVNERELASWHLFGEVQKSQPVQKPKPVEAPETRLQLTLSGLFASDDPEEARAIIGDPRGQEQSYAVGDPLPGGATLSEIYSDRIILKRGGRFETLRLPRDESVAGSPRVSHRDAMRVNSSGAGNRAAAFERYREEIKQNPATFLNYVRVTPYKQDGRFVGFALQEGPQAGAFTELGLSPGDVVTAINGVQIETPADGMRAMQTLGEGDSVNVTLLRNGEETTLDLTLPSSR